MRLAAPTRNDRIAIGASLILAPIFILLSTLALPPLKSDAGAELTVISANQGRYYLFILFGTIAAILFLPASYALMQVLRVYRSRLGVIGGLLALVASCLTLLDYGSELLKWQMATHTADAAQMTEVLKRFDTSAGSAIPLQLSGLFTLAGFVLLAIGLCRGCRAPLWLAVGLVVGVFLSLAGFVLSSVHVLDIGALLLIPTMGTVGLGIIQPRQEPTGTRDASAVTGLQHSQSPS